MKIKVVSFNMKRSSRFCRNNKWSDRTDAIRAFFRNEKPDIVGTQEMLHGYIAQAEKLLPAYGWVGEGRRGGKAGEYTAIFYRKDRFKVVDWGIFWLSRTPDEPGSRAWFSFFPRTCTWAVLESYIDGSRIQVYNTHLDNISFWARLKGLSLIQQHMNHNADPNANQVLMGDFNASPKSRAISRMRAASEGHPWLDGVRVKEVNMNGRTYHGFRGKVKGRPIDYIFASDGMEILASYINRQQYHDQFPSDHYPIVMVANTQ